MALYRRVHDSFARQGLMKTIGANLGRVDKGYVEIELPHSEKINQQQGGFHGGSIGAIADTAAGLACLTVAPEGMEVTTVEYKINFLSNFTGGKLLAVGKVIKPGKRVIISTAEIFHLDNAIDHKKRTLCAVMQQTIMPVHKSY
jgi:uncharacterized protein (TIGR00369 family)